MEIKRVPISQVEPWKDNPRNIKKVDFERLKKQIQELQVYKPMVAFRQDGKYIVLGGNMRLLAYQELGHKEVDLSLIKPKNQAEKIKYALSDNDRAGEYDEQMLAELVYPHIEEIDLEEYKVDIAESMSLKKLVSEYIPDFKEKELDENIETENECPKCGYKW